MWCGAQVAVEAAAAASDEGVLRRILSGAPDESELELQVLSYIVNLRTEPRGAGDGSAGGEAATLGGADVNGRGSMGAGGQGPG